MFLTINFHINGICKDLETIFFITELNWPFIAMFALTCYISPLLFWRFWVEKNSGHCLHYLCITGKNLMEFFLYRDREEASFPLYLSAVKKIKTRRKLCPSFYSSGRDTAMEQMSRVIFSIVGRKFVSQLLTVGSNASLEIWQKQELEFCSEFSQTGLN